MGKAFFWVLSFLAVGTIAFMGGSWYKGNNSTPTSTPTSTVAATATSTSTSTPTATTTTTPTIDPYAGWKTYTNNVIGYKLRYPSGWIVKEVNTTSEVIEKDVKYITITNPDKKYFLAFGLKLKTDAFVTSDRTGIGAGDFVKNGKITILGTKVDIEQLSYKNKIKEVFYPQSITKTADGKYQFTASFSANDIAGYDSLDMTNLTEEAAAEKILKSVELL